MARTISKVGLQSSGFCPICLRKLQVSVGYKIAERYKALMQWMEEDQRSMMRPLSLGLPSPVPNPLKPLMRLHFGSTEAWTYWGEKELRCFPVDLETMERTVTSKCIQPKTFMCNMQQLCAAF